MLEVNTLVNWQSPYDHRQFAVFIDEINEDARTVDVTFEDGSRRGSIPWEQIVGYDPTLSVAPEPGKSLRPKGIESGEGFGRF